MNARETTASGETHGAYTVAYYPPRQPSERRPASWPSNFSGSCYAVLDSAGNVLSRFAFRADALAWVARRQRSGSDA